MSEELSHQLEVRTYFVRGRNALLARANFEALYIDYYLHLADQKLRYGQESDQMLKDLLALLCLHLASKPQDEGAGWTVNIQEPLMNLFVTGSSRPAQVVGRVFTEDVRAMDQNMMVAQIMQNGKMLRQSMVRFDGKDLLSALEQFYEQSEQRLMRVFRYGEEDLVMISAQPDCDEEWLTKLTDADIRELDKTETLSLLEQRFYAFQCGCSVERLYPMLTRLSGEDLDHAFGEEGVASVTCPRCASRFIANREQFDAWLVQNP